MAQHRHPRIGGADLQGRTFRDGRPAAERRKVAIGGEGLAAGLVERMLGTRRGDAGEQAVAGDGVTHEGDRIDLADVAATEVPVRIERYRVDLAEVEVVEHERIRIGGQQIELRLVDGRQRLALHQRLQRLEVVVLRAKTIVLDVLQHLDERHETRTVP